MSDPIFRSGEINSANVARDVIATVARGERVNFNEIIQKHGYKESVAMHPKLVTERYGYIKETEAVIKKLWTERERAIRLIKKKVSSAEYEHLINGIDKLTKNILLLQGKPTENQGYTSLQDMFAREEEKTIEHDQTKAIETEYQEVVKQDESIKGEIAAPVKTARNEITGKFESNTK